MKNSNLNLAFCNFQFAMKRFSIVTRSELQTRSWGEKLGKLLSGGEIIGLTGELGSGKTCFVRGMASGGMGDVLSGILAGLIAQGFEIEDALKLGVYLHGFVGDQVAAAKGEIGLIASDIIEGLPAGMRELSKGTRQ